MHCSSCKRNVTPTAPRTMWKIVTVGFYIGALAFAGLFSVIIGLNLVLAPAAIFVGMAIGAAARRAASWTCPRCHYEMAEPARVEPDHVPGIVHPNGHAYA